MLEMTPQDVTFCHDRGPHLPEAVSLAALFAISISFTLTADGTVIKTANQQAKRFDANTAKERKKVEGNYD